MEIPAALHYSVPRGGWEFASAGLRGRGGMSADLVAVAAGATNTRAADTSDSARCDSQREPCRQLKTHTPCKRKHGGLGHTHTHTSTYTVYKYEAILHLLSINDIKQ